MITAIAITLTLVALLLAGATLHYARRARRLTALLYRTETARDLAAEAAHSFGWALSTAMRRREVPVLDLRTTELLRRHVNSPSDRWHRRQPGGGS